MKNIITLVIIVLFSLLIYWFQIRPANIRTKCSDYAMEKSVALYPLTSERDTTKRTILQEEMEVKLYSSCLHEKGLEK